MSRWSSLLKHYPAALWNEGPYKVWLLPDHRENPRLYINTNGDWRNLFFFKESLSPWGRKFEWWGDIVEFGYCYGPANLPSEVKDILTPLLAKAPFVIKGKIDQEAMRKVREKENIIDNRNQFISLVKGERHLKSI